MNTKLIEKNATRGGVKGRLVEINGIEQFIPHKRKTVETEQDIPYMKRDQMQKHLDKMEDDVTRDLCEWCSTHDMVFPKVFRICQSCIDDLIKKIGFEEVTVKKSSQYGHRCNVCKNKEHGLRTWIYNPRICQTCLKQYSREHEKTLRKLRKRNKSW